jgi:tetratricopeptide (TPR) repeat protein
MIEEKRLDGWKSISSYLGRERSTTMRWHKERALPVRRMPGGKQGTVFAYSHELDAWIKGNHDEFAKSQNDGIRARLMRVNLKWAVPLVITAIPLVTAIYNTQKPSPPLAPELSLPKDPQLTQIYVNARAEWSKRQPDSIDRAIRGFETVIAREPGFAAAHASLAEAWLLKRYFGNIKDGDAFAIAKPVALKALALDPNLAAAHRAVGFIQYWGEHNPKAAGASFRRAIQLAPGESQSYHWYATILSDNGQHEPAMRNFAKALALQPSLIQIKIDQSWGYWSAGVDETAESILQEVAPQAPDNATVAALQAEYKLFKGDWTGYANGLLRYGNVRKDTRRINRARNLIAAGKSGGQTAIAKAELAMSIADADGNPYQTYDWAASIASLIGNREELVHILRKASARREQWGNAGYRLRIANRWRDDPEITELLLRVAPQPVEG